jgi:hypothetical protein
VRLADLRAMQQQIYDEVIHHQLQNDPVKHLWMHRKDIARVSL